MSMTNLKLTDAARTEMKQDTAKKR